MSLRRSVPTAEISRYWGCGWGYVMPDFDKPGHSIIEWLSSKMPVYPVDAKATARRDSFLSDQPKGKLNAI